MRQRSSSSRSRREKQIRGNGSPDNGPESPRDSGSTARQAHRQSWRPCEHVATSFTSSSRAEISGEMRQCQPIDRVVDIPVPTAQSRQNTVETPQVQERRHAQGGATPGTHGGGETCAEPLGEHSPVRGEALLRVGLNSKDRGATCEDRDVKARSA